MLGNHMDSYAALASARERFAALMASNHLLDLLVMSCS